MPQRLDPDDADVLVLLTPRAIGGHEIALFAWLADGGRQMSLRPLIHAPGPALREAAASVGLAPSLAKETPGPALFALLLALWRWPAHKPLLLAPGVLHASAWLLAVAVLLGRRLWVYVPMTYSASEMGFRFAAWRDVTLRPWLRHVDTWITLDPRQAGRLRDAWQVRSPVLTLPNPLRRVRSPPPWPAPAADGRLRVVFVGRFDAHQKGLDWLMRLLRGPPGWTLGCQWRFQGSGPAESELWRLAVELGGDRVIVQRPGSMRHALAHADVLLLASRFEGFPLVALEATALGWPVVATHGSHLADFLPASSLFDFGDGEGLRRALHGLWAPMARQQAVAHARAALSETGLTRTYWAGLAEVCHALKHARTPARAPSARQASP